MVIFRTHDHYIQAVLSPVTRNERSKDVCNISGCTSEFNGAFFLFLTSDQMSYSKQMKLGS